MASPQRIACSEPAKVEQIITEFFTKSLHIILEARSPCVSSRNYSGYPSAASSPSSSSSTSSIRPRDKWFNLALRECPAALENLDWWRQSNLEMLVIDVVLVRRPLSTELTHLPPEGCLLRNLSAKEHYPNWSSSGHDELLREGKSEKIIERWIIQYESQKSGGLSRQSNTGSKKNRFRSSDSEMKKMYSRSIVLLRSLYATVRLLPAYKIYRDLNSSGQISSFSMTHKISSFVEPFTRKEDTEMTKFGFVSVDTSCGRLCLSVSYLPRLEDLCLEPPTPLCTQFISDYVGSPLADPLKRIVSLPTTGSSPTVVPFSRRHSWSYDYGATPSMSPSPSPTYSDSHASKIPRSLPYGHANVGNSPQVQLISRDMSLLHKETTSFDEYWPSPPFSPSSSPSPPTHLPNDDPSKAFSRTESCPVRLSPTGVSGLHNHSLPPTPSLKGSRPRCPIQPNIVMNSVGMPGKKQIPLKMGDLQTEKILQKAYSFDKYGVAGMKPFCTLDQGSLSRSSARLSSFTDDNEHPDFACPFAVDDEEFRIGHYHENNETFETGRSLPLGKSHDAAVGALVHMLRTAPPLRQDVTEYVKSEVCTPHDSIAGIQSNETADLGAGSTQKSNRSSCLLASALLKSRTAADALEELRNYKEMKDMILNQGLHGEPKPMAAQSTSTGDHSKAQ